MPDLTPLEQRLNRMKEQLCCDSFIEMEQLIGILCPYIAKEVHPVVGRTPRVILNGLLDSAGRWRRLKELID